MKIRNLSCTTGVLALLLVAATAPLIAMEPKGLLKAAEVKALVNSAASPADHLRLARHFTAMAEIHEAEAKEHEALATEYAKRPTGQEMKRPMTGQTAEHCKFYAEHCRKAATEVRAMATAHAQMAGTAK
jgi:hypothetical protein